MIQNDYQYQVTVHPGEEGGKHQGERNQLITEFQKKILEVEKETVPEEIKVIEVQVVEVQKVEVQKVEVQEKGDETRFIYTKRLAFLYK